MNTRKAAASGMNGCFVLKSGIRRRPSLPRLQAGFMRYLLFLLVFFVLSLPVRAEEKPASAPQQVFVGAHINDIQEVDLQSHSYRMDLYIWFRWRDAAIDPSKTAELMNAFDPADHVRTPLYDEPQKMPDGSLYMIFREQGKFSSKFPLQHYPFDRQYLSVAMEDTVHPADEMVYVPDDRAAAPASMNEGVRLPGFNIGAPELKVANFPYNTNFGDIGQPGTAAYSRAVFTVPIVRPWLATGIKAFLPVVLVLICTSLVFFVHPAYIEGRLGVAITALLTLVALQLTSASALPDVDYLLMSDKVYLLSYLFIIVTLMQVVRASRLVHAHKYDIVRRNDRVSLAAFTALLLVGVALICLTTF